MYVFHNKLVCFYNLKQLLLTLKDTSLIFSQFPVNYKSVMFISYNITEPKMQNANLKFYNRF